MRDHRKLKAFELADSLVLRVYQETRAFPKDEMFGVTSQLRRAAVSVAANIVEGSARQTQNDYVRFLDIALGSLREAGYYVDLASRLQYLPGAGASALHDRYEEAARVLAGLIQSLRRRS
jgi:four helix bundle protein